MGIMKKKIVKQFVGVGLVLLALLGSLALIQNVQLVQQAQDQHLQQTEIQMDKAISVLP